MVEMGATQICGCWFYGMYHVSVTKIVSNSHIVLLSRFPSYSLRMPEFQTESLLLLYNCQSVSPRQLVYQQTLHWGHSMLYGSPANEVLKQVSLSGSHQPHHNLSPPPVPQGTIFYLYSFPPTATCNIKRTEQLEVQVFFVLLFHTSKFTAVFKELLSCSWVEIWIYALIYGCLTMLSTAQSFGIKWSKDTKS